jgi:hypothetical protein
VVATARTARLQSRGGNGTGSQAWLEVHPEYRGRFINKSVPVGGFGAELGTYLGVRDVKVDAYWKFGGSDKLDEVYVNKWKEGF